MAVSVLPVSGLVRGSGRHWFATEVLDGRSSEERLKCPLAPVSLFEGLGAVVNFGRKEIRFEKLQDETTISRLPQWTLQHESDDFPRTGWYLPSTFSAGRKPMYICTVRNSDLKCWPRFLRSERKSICLQYSSAKQTCEARSRSSPCELLQKSRSMHGQHRPVSTALGRGCEGTLRIDE